VWLGHFGRLDFLLKGICIGTDNQTRTNNRQNNQIQLVGLIERNTKHTENYDKAEVRLSLV